MTYRDLSPTDRRHLIRRAILRPTLSATILFVLYFTLPLNRSFSDLTVFGLVAGLVVFAAVIVLQVRAIVRSPYPRLTAIESLAISIPLFVLSFSTVYYLMQRSDPRSFTERLTRLDSLYFTVTTLTTVGFGDIAAQSEVARALTTVQMAGDLVLLGFAARVVLRAVQTGLTRRSDDTASRTADQDRA
jgi:preprotein translocase subunit YajC